MNLLKRKLFLYLMLGTIVPSMICSCGDDDEDIILDPDAGQVVDNSEYATRLEVPALREGDGIYFVVHEANVSNSSSTDKFVNYCLEYDSSAYHSRWVAFVFEASNAARNVSRSDNAFAADPLLPATCRLGANAYSGSGYNRGHLCASADRLCSTEANVQTFYMSNMSPQMASFNQGYWITLEGLVQKWGRSGKYDRLYVVKGGTIRAGQRKSDSPWVTTNTEGRTARVVIPQYYFMAILAEINNTYQAIGFWMEHKEYGYKYSSPAPTSLMKTHAMSIDDLEELSGIDFFHNLNDKAEAAVESSYNENSWTW